MPESSVPYDLHKSVEHLKFGFQIIRCPVCGGETMDNHWVCPTCQWEYDGITDENIYSDCNGATIAQYRKENT